MEVPTDVLVVLRRQLLDQTIDISVPLADLQGFTPSPPLSPPLPSSPGQHREQNVDIPVPGGRGSSGYGGLQGFHPEQSSLEPSVEQTVDISVPSGGLQGLRPKPGSAAPSGCSARASSRGVFAPARAHPRRRLVRTEFGVRSSENTSVDAHGDSWLLLSGTAHGSYWWNLDTQHKRLGTPSWVPLPTRGQVKHTGVQVVEAGWTWSSTEALENFTHFHVELDLGKF